MVFLKKRRGKFVVVCIKWVCHPYVGSAIALPDNIIYQVVTISYCCEALYVVLLNKHWLCCTYLYNLCE